MLFMLHANRLDAQTKSLPVMFQLMATSLFGLGVARNHGILYGQTPNHLRG